MPMDEWMRHFAALATPWSPAGPTATDAIPPFPPFPPFGGFPPTAGAAFDPRAAGDGFAAAWRSALDAAAPGSDPARAAATAFAQFLRSQFGDPAAYAAIGPQRAANERLERIGTASRLLQESQARLARLWSDALRDAAEGFARRALDPAHAAAKADALYDAWIDCAEDAYGRMAHGEAYCAAQADLVNAHSTLRAEARALLEHWAKALDLPTRSELNSLHRSVKALQERADGGPAPRAARPRTPKRRPPDAPPQPSGSKRRGRTP
jgi:Poly(R)-hydroxyalkanoic acid synthase subunit (PHA_synth_III_E)